MLRGHHSCLMADPVLAYSVLANPVGRSCVVNTGYTAITLFVARDSPLCLVLLRVLMTLQPLHTLPHAAALPCSLYSLQVHAVTVPAWLPAQVPQARLLLATDSAIMTPGSIDFSLLFPVNQHKMCNSATRTPPAHPCMSQYMPLVVGVLVFA